MCNFLYMILSVDPPCKLMLISVKPLLTNSHCSGMMKEVKSQVKAGVEIGTFWKALTKDMRFIIPKIVPNLVKEVELVEGDGGLGSVLLFKFGSDVSNMSYQKEKIVELDECLHIISLQVVEGGHLNLGFSVYKTTFQLTSIGEHETSIDVIVAYESEVEESSKPSKTTASALAFIKCLESYLLNGAS
ncbi:phytohormone-binding protein-like isoform X1 [Pistacia vera]|uniref:phytohormone-binding protein-like isoform X1 n=1 Tax=Pistacia vera TaxID=55513 RepID=UPI001263183C|nr:phytohormone-binding protein-like isoform X1 [Pistacia vera]